jgi:RNA polymerase sigma-70 factor (ECF subfamily)
MRFEETYRAHFKFVWRSLRRLGVPRADLPDACQEVFVVVYKKLESFEHRSRVTTWLFGICFRVAQARTRRAYRHREVADEDLLLRVPSEGSDAVSKLERHEALAIAEAILARMSLEQRAVFVLFELQEMSSQEIAESLEIPRGTVHSRLRLARRAFRASLARMRAVEASGLLEAVREVDPPKGQDEAVWSALLIRLRSPEPKAAPKAGAGAGFTQAAVAAIAVAVGIATTIAPRSTIEAPVLIEAPMRAPASPVRSPVQWIAADPLPPPLPIAPRRAKSPPRLPPKRTEDAAKEAPQSALAEESRLLELARRDLREGDPESALRVLEEARARFSTGAHEPERRALSVEARFAHGEHEAAVKEANAFLEAHPSSPLAQRVRAFLE